MSPKSKSKFANKILSGLLLILLVLASPIALAQDETIDNGDTLYEPIEKQIIQLTDEGSLEEWNISKLETYGIKFLIRGKEALTWTLNIEDGGFHNPAIEKSYVKVLTIVNSLFILGLLAIAIMWMFSIIIPRKYLKKVILIYSLAVIFVNFALPANQLLIDGTNLLQKTLLVGNNGKIQITDIVQTPTYSEAISYRNEEASNTLANNENLTLDLEGEGISLPIGTITSPTLGVETIGLTSNPISITKNSQFSLFQEQTIFRFGIMMATGIAYFTMALIFVLRIVILWALLILSPILLILAIFKSTRGWFFNWLSLYGRWLLIGPLTALGISMIVNIWQLSGLPIEVSETYNPEIFSAVKDSNILFYLPGKDTANTLSNTQEMMEYIIFLIMLYIPIFISFALTKQKVLQASALAVSKKIISHTQSSQSQLIQTTHESNGQILEVQTGLVGSIKNLVNEKIELLTKEIMPINKLKTKPDKPTKMMESAHNFLPENLQNTPIPKMLELLGREKGSKRSHTNIIEKIAHFEQIKNINEREKVQGILNEIQKRAQGEDREAMAILHEIETIKEVDITRVNSDPNNSTIQGNSNNSTTNIHLSDKKHEDDKKVKDRSFNKENGKKNTKKKKHHKKKKRHNQNMNNNTNTSEQNAN